MFSSKLMKQTATICMLVAIALLTGLSAQRSDAQVVPPTKTERHAAFQWATQARKSQTALWTKVHGSLTINDLGMEFQPKNGRAQHWTYEEIHTAFLGPHRVVIVTYLNRSLHRPGVQHFQFDLSRALPPAVAAELAARIGRPVQNDDPDASAPAMTTILVRHRGLMHGTNGVLRFRKNGIDYVTSSKGDSRSWRWADIQALSQPDPYHLYVFGYRDTYTFDLKAPLGSALFHFATDEIYRAAEAGGER
jgi:hypothetical protein